MRTIAARAEGLQPDLLPLTLVGDQGRDLMLPRGSLPLPVALVRARRRAARTAGVVTDTGGAIYWNGRIVTDPANFFVPPCIPKSHNCLAIRSRKICCWASTSGRGPRRWRCSVCKGCGGYASGFGNFGGTEGRATLGGNCSGRQQLGCLCANRNCSF